MGFYWVIQDAGTFELSASQHFVQKDNVDRKEIGGS